MSAWRKLAVIAGCAALAAAGMHAVLTLPEPSFRLAAHVEQALDRSGVTHAVTAVLLNFRGYDTLLEVAVLLLALLGVLAAGGRSRLRLRRPPRPNAYLQALAGAVAPLMVVVAGYLLWAGSHRPGGAFQAAALLAAGMILLHFAGRLPARAGAGWASRAGLAGGFLVFLGVAALPLPDRALLQYPEHLAGALILMIESALTVSLALILAALFLRLPDETDDESDEEAR